MKNYGFDNKELNNIQPDKIVKILNEKLTKLDSSNISDKLRIINEFETTKNIFIGKIEILFNELFDELANNVETEIGKKTALQQKDIVIPVYRNLPDTIISIIKNTIPKQDEKPVTNIMNNKYFENLSKFNPNYNNLQPAFKVGFLESLNYKPDNDSNKNKNSNERQYDNLHLSYAYKCDIFLTEDKKLYDKSKVDIIENNQKLKIFDMKEFYKQYKNEGNDI
jgi:hypothetical protein